MTGFMPIGIGSRKLCHLVLQAKWSFGAMQVSLSQLVADHVPDMRSIVLKAQDVAFSTSVDDFLADNEKGVFPYVILLEEDVVGFFKIEESYHQTHDFCPADGLGLRMVAIDNRQQGKGIGTAMIKALPALLRERHSDFSVVYLTVNCKNPAAKRCYEKGGFEDTGALYLGGDLGPQHIMFMRF